MKSAILILVNTLDQKKIENKNKILLKDLISTDEINTRKYIRSEQERIVRKIHKKNNINHLRLHKYVWSVSRTLGLRLALNEKIGDFAGINRRFILLVYNTFFI